MEFSVKPTVIKSKKTNKDYRGYVLTIGDFQKLFFPNGRMESTYLERVVGNGVNGISVEIDIDE